MAKLFTVVIGLILLSGCNLFRKKSENIHFSTGRDSVWDLQSGTSLQNDHRVKNKSGTVDFQLRGFDKVSVSKDGKITAEGKGGELNYNAAHASTDSSSSTASTSQSINKGQVQDSTLLNKKLDIETSSEVDSWFSWWMIIGICMITMFFILVAFDVDLGSVWKSFGKFLKF
ncbi:hypothetical protein [Sphingobacterium kitahiroshimense]|uniref:hypothetical protein n=1 Tax=Sphingobacterium kitahiroshimense TaxID=470446 RepID=UPI00320A4C87